jgi:hypothetical protein
VPGVPFAFDPTFTCGLHGSGQSTERRRQHLFFSSSSYIEGTIARFVTDSDLSTVANNDCVIDSDRVAGQCKIWRFRV